MTNMHSRTLWPQTDMIASLATCSLARKFISQRGSLKLEQVTCAASLAHHGYIRTIEDLKLERLDNTRDFSVNE